MAGLSGAVKEPGLRAAGEPGQAEDPTAEPDNRLPWVLLSQDE